LTGKGAGREPMGHRAKATKEVDPDPKKRTTETTDWTKKKKGPQLQAKLKKRGGSLDKMGQPSKTKRMRAVRVRTCRNEVRQKLLKKFGEKGGGGLQV